jgi:hypothetical protein
MAGSGLQDEAADQRPAGTQPTDNQRPAADNPDPDEEESKKTLDSRDNIVSISITIRMTK